MQREVAPWSQGHVALHSAAGRREIKEYAFGCAVVGLDAGGVPHVDSWTAPELHTNLTASVCIGNAEKNLKAVRLTWVSMWLCLIVSLLIRIEVW